VEDGRIQPLKEHLHEVARITSESGNAPSHKLFKTVQIVKKDPVAPPRCYDDYQVTILENEIPEGVTVSRMV